MFSLSSLRLENWPPCLRAPPRLDKENIFRGNSYQMEYMQEHTGRRKFMHLQIEYFVPKRKDMKWWHCVKKEKRWSSGMTKYSPKSNPRHQRPSLKAENGRGIRRERWFLEQSRNFLMEDNDDGFQSLLMLQGNNPFTWQYFPLEPISLLWGEKFDIWDSSDQVWRICNSGGGDPKLARERPLIQTSNFSKDPWFDQMSKYEGFYSFRLDWDEWGPNYQQFCQILCRSFEMALAKVSYGFLLFSCQSKC